MTTGTPPMRSTSLITYWPNGLTLARCGTLSATRVEVLDVELDVGLVRDREQVQHRVGRPAERHDDGDGVASDSRVMMSRVVMPRRSSSTTASPERWA